MRHTRVWITYEVSLSSSSFEMIANCTACCDGKHLVGDHKHYHSHRHDRSKIPVNETPSVRAWSVASRRKSTVNGKPTAASLFGIQREGEGQSMMGNVRAGDERYGTTSGRSKSAMGFREGTVTPTPAMR